MAPALVSHIVKRLVGAHGGQVEVSSPLGQETRFSVRLPLATATHTPPHRGEEICSDSCRRAGWENIHQVRPGYSGSAHRRTFLILFGKLPGILRRPANLPAGNDNIRLFGFLEYDLDRQTNRRRFFVVHQYAGHTHQGAVRFMTVI